MREYKIYTVYFRLNGQDRWTIVDARSEHEAAFIVENGTIQAKGIDGTYELISIISDDGEKWTAKDVYYTKELKQ